MSNDHPDNLTGAVRPDAIDDYQVIPRAGVHQGHDGDSYQGAQHTAVDGGAEINRQQAERHAEKERKKPAIVHGTPWAGTRLGTRISRGYQQGVLGAVLAAVLASCVAEFAGWPSPLEATGEALMESTPVPIAEFLLSHLGAAAGPAALLGALALAMLFGGIGGSLAALPGCGRARKIAGYLLSGTWMAFVLLHVVPPSDPNSGIVFICAFLGCLAAITSTRASPEGRREFITRTGVILGGATVLLGLLSVRPLLNALGSRQLFPFRPPRGIPVSGLADLVTPTDNFYIMDKVLEYPNVGPPGWRLAVQGAVRRPLLLDYETLLGKKSVSRYITMECVDNPVGGSLMGTALWTGVPVAEILREAGAGGDTIVFHSVDDYAEAAPRGAIEESGAVVAYGMNGHSLPRAHGYPARLILPGIYGFKSAKWLERIEVLHGPFGGHWQSHGWTVGANIHTTARIDVARREGGYIVVAGVAFAGRRGVNAVEVRVNGGPWLRATLGRPLSADAWVQWGIRLQGHGEATLEVRAIDGTDAVQSEVRHGAYPDGTSGWHSVTV